MNSVVLCESEWKVLHLGERQVSIWEMIGQNSVHRLFWVKVDSVRDTRSLINSLVLGRACLIARH